MTESNPQPRPNEQPSASAVAGNSGSAKPAPPPIDSLRETIESIAVAFILAFLFRTFVAEMFVIPTGSMATTLMGRHRDLNCPNCQYQFQASASSEADHDGNLIPKAKVVSALCPNCGFPVDTDDVKEFPSYKGDRILVSKLPNAEPQRWDVTVFRYPEKAGINYIKRLVGLPGEEIRIFNGDLFKRPTADPSQPWAILRKPPDVARAMMREVYDNDRVVDWMTKAGWPPRWQPCPLDIKDLVASGWNETNEGDWKWPAEKPAKAGDWTTEDDYRSFQTDGSAAKEVWLRYQHLWAYDRNDWNRLISYAPKATRARYFVHHAGDRDEVMAAESGNPIARRPALRHIDDGLAYNSSLVEKPNQNGILERGSTGNDHPGPWVGDLGLQFDVQPRASQGELTAQLIEGGHQFHCRINLVNGAISLTIDNGAVAFTQNNGQAGATELIEQDAAPIGQPFQLRFANVDSQLLVWINERLVSFDSPTTYDLPMDQRSQTTADFSPAGIAASGAKVRISSLKLLRDTYYLTYGNEELGREFPLHADQFFMLGDNSEQSADARSWIKKYVERKLLIGKAVFIFWPHSWDSPVPFTPNWSRMKFIK